MKIILAISICLFTVFGSIAQQNTMTLSIDTSTMRIGEQRTMKLEFLTDYPLPINRDWARSYIDSTAYIGADTIPIVGTEHFEVLQESKWSSKPQRGGKYLSGKEFSYTVWKDGYYMIPPFAIRVQTKDSFETLQVPAYHFLCFTPIDTTIQGLAPNRDIIKTDFDFDKIRQNITRFALLKLLLISLLLTAIVSLFPKTDKRNINRIPIAYHEILKNKINDLKNSDFRRHDKKCYTELSRIVRLALQQKFGIRAKEMTSAMIVRKLKKLQSSNHDELFAFLHRSDEVKYAKGKESEEQIKTDIAFVERMAKNWIPDDLTVKLSPMEVKKINPELYRQKRIESYQICSPATRWSAALIDAGILLLCLLLIFIPFGFLGYFSYWLENLNKFDILLALAFALWLYIFYFTLSHSWKGSTIGKKLVGSSVVDIDDGRLRMSKALLRAIIKLPGTLLLFAGIWWMYREKHHRTWHDLIANSFVVYKS